MDRRKNILKNYILNNNESEIINLLNNGLEPNFENGWLIRFAARNGHYSIVKLFLRHGGCPHFLNEAGASTLQLAVYSNAHWDTDAWTFLLSCCDSSQLADGAAVAIIFNNIAALRKILDTGRCNTNIPTTLTGKTVEDLAKGYKMQYLIHSLSTRAETRPHPVLLSPQPVSQQNRSRETSRSTFTQRNLSPSVARFFDLTASQTSLTPPHSPLGVIFSPTSHK